MWSNRVYNLQSPETTEQLEKGNKYVIPRTSGGFPRFSEGSTVKCIAETYQRAALDDGGVDRTITPNCQRNDVGKCTKWKSLDLHNITIKIYEFE